MNSTCSCSHPYCDRWWKTSSAAELWESKSQISSRAKEKSDCDLINGWTETWRGESFRKLTHRQRLGEHPPRTPGKSRKLREDDVTTGRDPPGPTPRTWTLRETEAQQVILKHIHQIWVCLSQNCDARAVCYVLIITFGQQRNEGVECTTVISPAVHAQDRTALIRTPDLSSDLTPWHRDRELRHWKHIKEHSQSSTISTDVTHCRHIDIHVRYIF